MRYNRIRGRLLQKFEIKGVFLQEALYLYINKNIVKMQCLIFIANIKQI